MCFAADHGLVQRADIMSIYEESGSDQGAADKAINRWPKAGRIVKEEASMNSATGEPSALSKVSMLVSREVGKYGDRYGG